MSDVHSGTPTMTPATPAVAEAPPSAPATPAPSTPFQSLSDTFAAMKVGSEEETGATAPEATDGQAPAIAEPPNESVVTPESKERLHWKAISEHPAHKAAVESARSDERKMVMSQLEQEMAPIRPVLPVAQAIARDVQHGTIDGLNQLLSEYAQHPSLGPQLRSMFGKALAQLRGGTPPQTPAADPEPEADLQLPDGTPVFSAPQLSKWNTWHAKQQEQQLGKKFEPLIKLQERIAQATEQQQQVHSFLQGVTPLAQELAEMPGFKEHREEIARRQVELYQRDPRTEMLMSHWMRAYRDIVPQKLQAKQQEDQRTAALEASAGRSVNPATATPAAGQPRDLVGLFHHFGVGRAS